MSTYEDSYFGVEWDRKQHSKPWHDSEFLKNVYESDSRPSYRDIGDAVGVSYTMIKRNMPDDANKGGEGYPYEHIALFSGGHDSLVSSHKVMEELNGDCVVHIDTRTGLEENKQFVRDVCQKFDWTLEIIKPEVTLAEFAKEWGFPKAQAHTWIYAYLKQHPLDKFVTNCESDMPTFYAGVRKHESERRMRTVTPEKHESSHGRWYWESPIADFTDDDLAEYMDKHDLPSSSVVETIGRSGECFCGAFSDRFSELSVLKENYPDHYEWIMNLEDEVQSEIGTENAACYWGTGGMSSDDLQELMESEETDHDMLLCEDCEGGAHRTMGCEID